MQTRQAFGLGLLGLIVLGLIVFVFLRSFHQTEQSENSAMFFFESATSSNEISRNTEEASSSFGDVASKEMVLHRILKDVGEPMYRHFGLTTDDFSRIQKAGFTAIAGNFDICAADEDVTFFLDSAQQVGLKVILPAGAGEAEWGYPCDGNFTKAMTPVWQKEKVLAWVEKWKQHPALLMWDTSNEAGGVFPYGTGGIDPDPRWETKYALTEAQLRQAYRDVKSADPNHLIMIRMNGWYFYDNTDNFFRPGNAFGKDVADVVMVNAYANVEEYFADFVRVVMDRAAHSILAIDHDVLLIPSLGVWEEPPLWVLPTLSELTHDTEEALQSQKLYGIAYFKYGAPEGNGWYLPDPKRGSPELWGAIQREHRKGDQ